MLKNGVWTQEEADRYHQSSRKLAAFLSIHLNYKDPVIDMGCGNGFYCAELEKIGFKCFGVEGYPLNNMKNKTTIVQDLTKPFNLGVMGSVVCLEVLEHIDKKYERQVIDTIDVHCKKQLVLSWALTAQPGVGHVNCVDQSYAIKKMEERGFTYLHDDTLRGRTHVDDNTDWFRRTLLCFER